jgi:hypothetical protein
MVTGEKIVGVVAGLLQGFLRKVVCRTWFLDGECVVKRGEKNALSRALKIFLFLKIYFVDLPFLFWRMKIRFGG